MSAAVWSEAHVAECGRRDIRRVGGGPWDARSLAGIPIVRTPCRTTGEAIPRTGEPPVSETKCQRCT
jgi:hypothetical protein